jgi:hypothetical protein
MPNDQVPAPQGEAAIADSVAIERIHALLDSDEWSPDTLDAIADIIRATGRDINYT